MKNIELMKKYIEVLEKSSLASNIINLNADGTFSGGIFLNGLNNHQYKGKVVDNGIIYVERAISQNNSNSKISYTDYLVCENIDNYNFRASFSSNDNLDSSFNKANDLLEKYETILSLLNVEINDDQIASVINCDQFYSEKIEKYDDNMTKVIIKK